MRPAFLNISLLAGILACARPIAEPRPLMQSVPSERGYYTWFSKAWYIDPLWSKLAPDHIVHRTMTALPDSRRALYFIRIGRNPALHAEARRGVVLLMHGPDENMTVFEPVIVPLLRAGYDVLLPDLTWGADARDHVNWTRREALWSGIWSTPAAEIERVFERSRRKMYGAACWVERGMECDARSVIWAERDAAELALAMVADQHGNEKMGMIYDAETGPTALEASADLPLLLLQSRRDHVGRIDPTPEQWTHVLALLDRIAQQPHSIE